MVYHKEGCCESHALDPARHDLFVTRLREIKRFPLPSSPKNCKANMCVNVPFPTKKPLLICVDSITCRMKLTKPLQSRKLPLCRNPFLLSVYTAELLTSILSCGTFRACMGCHKARRLTERSRV